MEIAYYYYWDGVDFTPFPELDEQLAGFGDGDVNANLQALGFEGPHSIADSGNGFVGFDCNHFWHPELGHLIEQSIGDVFLAGILIRTLPLLQKYIRDWCLPFYQFTQIATSSEFFNEALVQLFDGSTGLKCARRYAERQAGWRRSARERGSKRGWGAKVNKIVKGGQLPDQFLCETCTLCASRRGSKGGSRMVICQAERPFREVTFRVVECSDYRDENAFEGFEARAEDELWPRAWQVVVTDEGNRRLLPATFAMGIGWTSFRERPPVLTERQLRTAKLEYLAGQAHQE